MSLRYLCESEKYLTPLNYNDNLEDMYNVSIMNSTAERHSVQIGV